MSPAYFKELGWLLMLIPFGVVLAIGFFFVYCAWRRRFFPDATEGGRPGSPEDGGLPMRHPFFERPSRWLAVKSNSVSAVQAALNLHHAVPCSCEEGLVEAREDKLFVSPRISGWVLVVGPGLPDPGEDVDFCYRFLRNLSRKLGNVQFYSVNRALNHHAWALLEDGRVYRAYAWAGETLWNEGYVTAAERELGMVCFEYGSQPDAFTSRETLAHVSDKLNQLAARWSLDPAAIPESSWRAPGIVGEFS